MQEATGTTSSKQILVGIVIVALVGLGALWLIQQSSSDSEMMKDEVMVESTKMDETDDTMMQKPQDEQMKEGVDAMENDETSMESDAMMVQSEGYVDYSPEAYAAAEGKTRILYFYANWCPTCKVANEDFIANKNNFPENVVVFRVNYDTEDTLKQKYGITYQHTFVVVDENGNAVTKWNGGDFSTLVEKVQ